MPEDPFPYGNQAEPLASASAPLGVVTDDVQLGQDELADVDEGFAPPKAPYPKVKAAGAAGAAATLLVFLAPLAGIEVPAEVAAALATVLAFAAGYLQTE